MSYQPKNSTLSEVLAIILFISIVLPLSYVGYFRPELIISYEERIILDNVCVTCLFFDLVLICFYLFIEQE